MLPPGVKAPVVLISSPYFGQTTASGDVDDYFAPRWLVDHGYAGAAVSLRGTGNSGGCLDFFGTSEQRDQALLVEWLAAKPWSNGRVAMYGLSYMGTTPWEAAIQTVLATCKEFKLACAYPVGEADVETRMQQGFNVAILQSFSEPAFRTVAKARQFSGRDKEK